MPALNAVCEKHSRTSQCVGKQDAKVNAVAFLVLIASLLTTAEAVWEISFLSVTDRLLNL